MEEWRYSYTHFFTYALDGGEWLASSCSSHFTLRKRAPQYPLNRRLSGPQSHSACGGKEKNP